MELPIVDSATGLAVVNLHYTAMLRGFPVPSYNTEPCSSGSTSEEAKYKCVVTACNIEAEGFGPTEKIAKRNSARKAMELLTYFVDGSICPRHVKCYEVELRNFATVRYDTLPVYKLVPDADTDAPYVYKCYYLTYKVKGYGSTKKSSKENAARRLIELLVKNGVMIYS